MFKLKIVTAAFAAGLTCFAAQAGQEVGKVETLSAKPIVKSTVQSETKSNKAAAKKLAAKTEASKKTAKNQTKKAAKAERRQKVAAASTAKSRSSKRRVSLKLDPKKGTIAALRNRDGVDDVVTGSIAPKGKSGGSYNAIVSRYAAAYGVPTSLAHAVIRVESNYRVNARGSAGEIGLMQIKPATARMMGYSGSANGLFNPETNIKYGVMYLAKAHKLGGGSTCGTILKYNAGHGAKRMNPISAAYCSKVKRHLSGRAI